MKQYISIFFFLLFSVNVSAQVGGDNTYEFLNLVTSARAASLGGNVIAIKDNDLSLPYYNPSLLNPTMDKMINANYANYFAGVKYGYVSYSMDKGKLGSFAAGINYLNYGEFIEADYTGQITGSFYASEYALNLIWSKSIDSLFSVGLNTKPVLSSLESYTSIGLAFDMGVTYHNPTKLFTAAFVIKNAGVQLKKYYKTGSREPLPFEMQLGFSKQFKHAPFRFSLVVGHLDNYKLAYNSPLENEDILNPEGKQYNKSKLDKFADEMMRHIVVGAEFIPSDNFHLRIGYNYKLRKELKIKERASTVGFSWGFGIRISKFQISYGSARYHLAGSTNLFSISSNLGYFYKKSN